MNINRAEFIKSAVSPKDFLRDGLPGVVFSGRSNVGKSSVINRLLGRNGYARVSASPGKTAHINYFLIDERLYFIDLPGYGYAKVSKAERERWGRLMEQFFAETALISLGVMIVDARHKPTNDDVTMSNWFKAAGCPLIIVANKCDKLKKSELSPNENIIRETLLPDEKTKLVFFSAEKGTNRDELISLIESAIGV